MPKELTRLKLGKRAAFVENHLKALPRRETRRMSRSEALRKVATVAAELGMK